MAFYWKKCNFAQIKKSEKCNSAMLYRKISKDIEAHLRSGSDKILIVEGARLTSKQALGGFIDNNISSGLF